MYYIHSISAVPGGSRVPPGRPVPRDTVSPHHGSLANHSENKSIRRPHENFFIL